MSVALHVAAELIASALAIVAFCGCFFFAALNYVAAVFYGRADVTKNLGFRDFFTVDASAFTAMGRLARRCVLKGVAGMGAVLLMSIAAVFVGNR